MLASITIPVGFIVSSLKWKMAFSLGFWPILSFWGNNAAKIQNKEIPESTTFAFWKTIANGFDSGIIKQNLSDFVPPGLNAFVTAFRVLAVRAKCSFQNLNLHLYDLVASQIAQQHLGSFATKLTACGFLLLWRKYRFRPFFLTKIDKVDDYLRERGQYSGKQEQG